MQIITGRRIPGAFVTIQQLISSKFVDGDYMASIHSNAGEVTYGYKKVIITNDRILITLPTSLENKAPAKTNAQIEFRSKSGNTTIDIYYHVKS